MHPPSLCRHPCAHDYYDPNDYIGGTPQDLDREELELEVPRDLVSFRGCVNSSGFSLITNWGVDVYEIPSFDPFLAKEPLSAGGRCMSLCPPSTAEPDDQIPKQKFRVF